MSSPRCPKCKTGIIVTRYFRQGSPSNQCTLCGLSHTIGDSRESLDRQIRGPAWKNPRKYEAKSAVIQG